MSSTMLPAVPLGSRRIVIEGLQTSQDVEPVNLQTSIRQKLTQPLQKLRRFRRSKTLHRLEQVGWEATVDEQSNSTTVTMIMNEDEPISQLWKRIEEYGFRKPFALYTDDQTLHEQPDNWVVTDHDEVVVVAADQSSTKNTIRITDPLILHANIHYGQPIDFNINSVTSSQRTVEDNCGFHVSFERTPRMPDDNKLHQLPGSLGSYDMFSVEAYVDRLPAKIRESGGVFLPMWQREAMWLNFHAKAHMCVVRVFIGRVNVVSGLTMKETTDKEDDEREQDYIVLPDQQWLDGICVAPGIVRQFVAMPLGSGYTVEGQKTAEEKYGGLQLEVTPEILPKQRFWSYAKDQHVNVEGESHELEDTNDDDGDSTPEHTNGLDEDSTPEQLGCKIGDILRSYPVDLACREPFRIKHLSESGTTVTFTVFNGYDSDTDSGMELVPRGCDTLEVDEQEEAMGVSGNDGYAGGYTQATAGGHSDARLNEEDLEADLDHLNIIDSKDIKAMGLAAGGKLIQDIYKDDYSATIWNHAAARILHVHILDPVSCEKVTHIVPTPPPTDAKAYAEAGGQFFVVEEKVDGRLDGGDFDNVKSVSQMDQHVGISTEPEFDPTKPKMCTTCELRLCDCIIRPCDHQFCNVCIKRIEQNSDENSASARRNWKCPTCDSIVSHVAGFSAPMNLPGEEPLRIKVPVNVLKIEDGRVRFESVQKTRI